MAEPYNKKAYDDAHGHLRIWFLLNSFFHLSRPFRAEVACSSQTQFESVRGDDAEEATRKKHLGEDRKDSGDCLANSRGWVWIRKWERHGWPDWRSWKNGHRVIETIFQWSTSQCEINYISFWGKKNFSMSVFFLQQGKLNWKVNFPY